MCKQILNFYLSDHAMYRCWDRIIDSVVLYKILPFVNAVDAEKQIVVITPSFLTERQIAFRNNACLILVLQQNLLITCYWCKDPNYLFKTEKHAEFQWLYM
ncbi:MAG: hypothetical protein WCI49_15165 [Ferruginibacter sp.]